jgi:hypothetical protein
MWNVLITFRLFFWQEFCIYFRYTIVLLNKPSYFSLLVFNFIILYKVIFQTSLYNTLILWIVLQLPPTNYPFSNSGFQMPFRTPRYFAPNDRMNCIPSNESSLPKWPKTSLVLYKSKACKKINLSLSAPWNHAHGWSKPLAPLIRIFGARRRSMFGQIDAPAAQPPGNHCTETWLRRRTGVVISENTDISSPCPKFYKIATFEFLTAELEWRFKFVRELRRVE